MSEPTDYSRRPPMDTLDSQKETSVDGGLGIHIKQKTLFHGTGVKDIQVFRPAEETTVGEGVYLTSQLQGAVDYARDRSEVTQTDPLVYETSIEDIKLLDLRNDENIQKILPGFQRLLEEILTKLTDEDPWYRQAGIVNILEHIRENKIKVGLIKLIAQSEGKLFSEYVQSLGYDGLITIEGGESKHTEDHDTYLVFNPEKVQIKGEPKMV
jgi:hypothetical protein